MNNMPKKSLFEGKAKFLAKVANHFENVFNMDPINAHYAAQYWIDNKNVDPELVIDVINKLNAHGENINPFNINTVIKKLQTQHKKAG